MQPSESVLRRSEHLSAFAHMGDVYLYHDLYGYILKMSPDILDFLAQFAEPAEISAVCDRYQDAFDGQPPQEFVGIFTQFACLVAPGEDELEAIWYMVPVKSKWNVWRRDDAGNITLYTAWGERKPQKIALNRAETELWLSFDGEIRLSDLRGDYDDQLVLDLVPRLVHHDVQALKLSAFPMSTYKGRPKMRPPYLTSTMPYAPYVPGAGTETAAAPGKHISTEAYYRGQVIDAEAQFDHRETTLSHLLRVPHPTLRGRTYGQALVDTLIERGDLPGTGSVRVLEIGAGLGYVARDAHARMRERGLEVSYDIVELSPALAEVQRQRVGEAGIAVREGDALAVELGTGYDFILANEMMGDLPAVELTHDDIGYGRDDDTRAAELGELGELGELISELGLNLIDAPNPFYLNTGAYMLLRRIWQALAPGGTCVVTEFGEPGAYPRLSTQLDHPELSIHFDHLQTAARAIGFDVAFEFIIDLLDFDRSLRGMVTTRSYFRALRTMVAEVGIELEKIGYTETMFYQLIAGKLSKGEFGDIYFDRIEDRLMGLVPHEFKAVIARRPA